jgi:hypothetical protein
MSNPTEQAIKIWSYSKVPKTLRRLSDKEFEWVVLIPPGFAWPEIEALFLRSYADNSVIRRTLTGASVLFLGVYKGGERDNG